MRRAAVLVLLLAACGGGDGPKYSTVAAMRSELVKVGLCERFEQLPAEESEIFVSDQGDCSTIDGHDLTLYVFSTDDSQGQWESLAGTFGGGWVRGKRWAVAGGTPAEQASARTALD